MEIAAVQLTPRMIVLAARGGLVLATAAVIVLGGTETAPPPFILLAGSGWALSLMALLAFPRVRRNDLLFSLSACTALAGYLTAPRGLEAGIVGALAGTSGPLAVSLTLALMGVRYKAASNPHMSFVEWRQFDRRRRRTDPQVPVKPAITVQNDG
jgi:hypothetical protein